jgi:hypothetical protein
VLGLRRKKHASMILIFSSFPKLRVETPLRSEAGTQDANVDRIGKKPQNAVDATAELPYDFTRCLR